MSCGAHAAIRIAFSAGIQQMAEMNAEMVDVGGQQAHSSSVTQTGKFCVDFQDC
jgi:hypothetical protein